jgi:arylsulfatase A-like enzyme
MPDIMPTLLKLAGLAIPGTVQGKDLSSLPTPERDAAAFINLAAPITEARRYGFAEYRGLRTLQHTYVRSIRGPWLLYDNHADPYQKNNVISNASYAKLLSSLDRSLDARLKQLGDSFLPAAEYLKRDSLTHYREVNVKVGHTRSPWGDWESTLT